MLQGPAARGSRRHPQHAATHGPRQTMAVMVVSAMLGKVLSAGKVRAQVGCDCQANYHSKLCMASVTFAGCCTGKKRLWRISLAQFIHGKRLETCLAAPCSSLLQCCTHRATSLLSLCAGAWSTFSGMGRSRSRTFPELSGISLGLFHQENRFRQMVYDTVTNRCASPLLYTALDVDCIHNKRARFSHIQQY